MSNTSTESNKLTAEFLLAMAVKFEVSPCFFTNGFFNPSGESVSEFSDGYYITKRKQLDETLKWSIDYDNCVYSKKRKDFIYESQPSSRTDKILKDTRFDSMEEAFQVFNEWKKKKLIKLSKDKFWKTINF